MQDIFDIVAAKILNRNQPKDVNRLATDLRSGLPDFKGLDDTPENRQKVAHKGSTIIRKAIEEMPVVGEPPPNIEDALIDFEEEQRDNAEKATEIVTDEEVDEHQEEVEEDSEVEQEQVSINKEVPAVKRADEATEILLLITDLMGQGHTYEEAKELAEQQVIGARTKGSATKLEDVMKKGQKVIYDTSGVVGCKINGRKITVKQRVMAKVMQINQGGELVLLTESGWRLTTPPKVRVAGKVITLVRAMDEDKDKDMDKESVEGDEQVSTTDIPTKTDTGKDNEDVVNKEGAEDDKDDDMEKESVEGETVPNIDVPTKTEGEDYENVSLQKNAADDDDDDDDKDKNEKEGADDNDDDDDKNEKEGADDKDDDKEDDDKTAADDEDDKDDDDDKKEGKKTSADIPEASQEGTLGGGNTDDKPEVGMEGGVNVSDHREKGRPDISQEGDVSGEASTKVPHLDQEADKEIATGTDNVLDNPVIKGKKDRIARLKTLRAVRNRQGKTKRGVNVGDEIKVLQEDIAYTDDDEEIVIPAGTLGTVWETSFDMITVEFPSFNNAVGNFRISEESYTWSKTGKVKHHRQAQDDGTTTKEDVINTLSAIGIQPEIDGDDYAWDLDVFIPDNFDKDQAIQALNASGLFSSVEFSYADDGGSVLEVRAKRKSNKNKQTSTGNQRTRLSRNARLKGLQTKVSQTERNNAVLHKKNRRLEAEKLADLMIHKGLCAAIDRDAEIAASMALTEEGWRQAKRIVEGAPDREPTRIKPRQGSRKVLRAVTQIKEGHGVRQGSNKPMKQAGGYLDDGSMFDD